MKEKSSALAVIKPDPLSAPSKAVLYNSAML